MAADKKTYSFLIHFIYNSLSAQIDAPLVKRKNISGTIIPDF